MCTSTFRSSSACSKTSQTRNLSSLDLCAKFLFRNHKQTWHYQVSRFRQRVGRRLIHVDSPTNRLRAEGPRGLCGVLKTNSAAFEH